MSCILISVSVHARALSNRHQEQTSARNKEQKPKEQREAHLHGEEASALRNRHQEQRSAKNKEQNIKNGAKRTCTENRPARSATAWNTVPLPLEGAIWKVKGAPEAARAITSSPALATDPDTGLPYTSARATFTWISDPAHTCATGDTDERLMNWVGKIYDKLWVQYYTCC